MTGPERDEMVGPEVLDGSAGVASDTRKRGSGLGFYDMVKGTVEPGTKDMSQGMKMERDTGIGTHRGHLD